MEKEFSQEEIKEALRLALEQRPGYVSSEPGFMGVTLDALEPQVRALSGPAKRSYGGFTIRTKSPAAVSDTLPPSSSPLIPVKIRKKNPATGALGMEKVVYLQDGKIVLEQG